MNKRRLSPSRWLLALLLAVASSLPALAQHMTMPDDATLRRQAARMLMVGFRGDTLSADSDAARYVRDLHVGAVVLFDVDLTGAATIGSRNVTSRERLAAMTAQLQQWSDQPLLIALDQEGGRVVRLKQQYGYEPLPSAHYVAQAHDEDTTRHYARLMAQQLASSGINVNLAPVVDLDKGNPAVTQLERSYGDDPDTVAQQAAWVIEELHRRHIAATLKHFPGHGSPRNDSHRGFVDATNTWSSDELKPFATLIQRNMADMIMTAHIFNANIDPDYPATLSQKTIDGLLRHQLGYDGVVVTDDLYMQAIFDHYSIEDALVLTINAGADMICVGNNISTGYEPERPFLLVDIIVKAVKDGRISPQRIADSNKRIAKLAAKLIEGSIN